ncbi:unnamed protein product [Leuciscus chuanchicus]
MTHNKDIRRMDLEISSASVSHSALYYCAVRPTVKGNTLTPYKNQSDLNNELRQPPENDDVCFGFVLLSGMCEFWECHHTS